MNYQRFENDDVGLVLEETNPVVPGSEPEVEEPKTHHEVELNFEIAAKVPWETFEFGGFNSVVSCRCRGGVNCVGQRGPLLVNGHGTGIEETRDSAVFTVQSMQAEAE